MGVFDKTTNDSIGDGTSRPTLLGGVARSVAEVQSRTGGTTMSEDIVVYGSFENYSSGYLHPLGGDSTAEGGDTADGSQKGDIHYGNLTRCLQLEAELRGLKQESLDLHIEAVLAGHARDYAAERPLRVLITENLARTKLVEEEMKKLNCADELGSLGLDIDSVGDETPPDWQV